MHWKLILNALQLLEFVCPIFWIIKRHASRKKAAELENRRRAPWLVNANQLSSRMLVLGIERESFDEKQASGS
jgi:hypothetical protein